MRGAGGTDGILLVWYSNVWGPIKSTRLRPEEKILIFLSTGSQQPRLLLETAPSMAFFQFYVP